MTRKWPERKEGGERARSKGRTVESRGGNDEPPAVKSTLLVYLRETSSLDLSIFLCAQHPNADTILPLSERCWPCWQLGLGVPASPPSPASESIVPTWRPEHADFSFFPLAMLDLLLPTLSRLAIFFTASVIGEPKATPTRLAYHQMLRQV
jgi:hypothetical protein